MGVRRASPVQIVVLVALAAGAIVAGVLLVGPPSTSSNTEIRLASVTRGVVQTSVSASGNLEPATEVGLDFKASGILTELYVHAGEHVTDGELLAEIDPTSAQVTLEEAQAALKSAQANLASVEADPSGSSSSSTGGSAHAASASSPAVARAAAFGGGTGATGATGTTGATGSSGSSGAGTGSTPATGTTGAGGSTSGRGRPRARGRPARPLARARRA
ncbi:MAG: biotin/lipoyl-binding protein [Solirubrobacteraceae bacterium]